jgi:hypothetical protein
VTSTSGQSSSKLTPKLPTNSNLATKNVPSGCFHFYFCIENAQNVDALAINDWTGFFYT